MLTKGQAIITVEVVSTSVLCRVHARYTPLGAKAPDTPAMWMDYFTKREKNILFDER